MAVGVATFFLIAMGWRAQTLLRQLALSLFFALGMVILWRFKLPEEE